MLNFDSKIGIYGAGGFGQETACYLMDCLQGSDYEIKDVAVFIVDDIYFKEPEILNIPVIKASEFLYQNYEILVAIADPIQRRRIVESLPKDARFYTLIHPKAFVSKYAEIEKGSIIAPGAVVSCNTKIGLHAHINYNSTIGHDCTIGNFFTASPGANVGGNCIIKENVFLGANSALREKLAISSDVTIGMGAVVVKNISEKGVYAGNPSNKIK